ncbi:hypothetical protein P6166_07955 [Stenotrophomonas sp. HITSZ_GD]|uniref:hypothetical protein n=1 Tax=Stenotrophomonas sp. HITSZ_GD TaxID=3037248 RepID=UPI00240DCDA2|nr:hypothetical protein [Stenotrophomonas sp. HITSZ_GD]MDG2525285.1 hypothetical protein [Stenotrophomonas sp. HITSZ_GD]
MDFIAFAFALALLFALGGLSTRMAWRRAHPRGRWRMAAAGFWCAGGAWAAAAWHEPSMDTRGLIHDTALPFAALAYLFTLLGVLASAWAAWGWRVHATAARGPLA